MEIIASQKRSSSRFAFQLGGFDHQRIDNGEAHGGGMEAIVHQALGHVFNADARAFLEVTQIDDTFMRHIAAGACVEHREMRLQTLGNVVGVEDGHDGGLAQAFAAHHGDIHP